MKIKFLFTLSFILLLSAAQAQFRNIPAVVTDAFKSKFPSANGVTWKDKISSFQADFFSGADTMKVNFSSKGVWLKTEKRYKYSNLPAEVKVGFDKSKYAAYGIKEAMEINDKDKGIQYRITVRKGELSKRYLYFNKAGQLLSDTVTL